MPASSSESFWGRVRYSLPFNYGLAVLTTCFAEFMALLLAPYLPESAFVLFVFAVVISSWFGGRGPGLLSTILGAIPTAYLSMFWVTPSKVTQFDNLLWFLMSILVILLINSLLTIRKQGQEALLRLGAVVESTDDAIIGQDLNGTITSWNSGAEKTFGYSAAEALQRSFLDLVVVDPAPLRAGLARIKRGEHLSLETEHLRKDGQRIQVALTLSPIRESRGRVIGAALVARDMSERQRAQAEREKLLASEQEARAQAEATAGQLRASAERLKVLSQRLMQAQELERRHIARELHDEIGQGLTAIKINLQMVRQSLTGEDLFNSNLGENWFSTKVAGRFPDAFQLLSSSAHESLVQESLALVERTLQQVRGLSLDLRPSVLDDLGLVSALRWYFDRTAERTKLDIKFFTHAVEGRPDPAIEIACFRVAQESMTNILRHAQAHQVRAELYRTDHSIELLVCDDGVGFDVHAARLNAVQGKSLGLLGMEERVLAAGGQLEIESTPGRGTEVRARFPYSTS